MDIVTVYLLVLSWFTFIGHSVLLGGDSPVSLHAKKLTPAGREEERDLFAVVSCYILLVVLSNFQQGSGSCMLAFRK